MSKLPRPARPLPDPDAQFDWVWRPGEEMRRVYHRHPGRPPLQPRTYGPIDSRWDPHKYTTGRRPREQRDGRGVLYLAEDLACALAEVFPEQRDVVQICPNLFSVTATPTADVRLLDLTGDGAMFIGAYTTLGSGGESRALTQAWAQAIYEDLSGFAGVRYRASHQGGIAVATWDRAPALDPVGPPAGDRLVSRRMRPHVERALDRQGRALEIVPTWECDDCVAAGLAGPPRLASR